MTSVKEAAARMTELSAQMSREPMSVKVVGAQKEWLDLYDQLCALGTGREKREQ